MSSQPLSSKVRGAILGLFIGDALAMPVHWYYDRSALQRDYGWVDRYHAPRNPHPNSILWRSHYSPVGPGGEILHEQAVYWGQREVHYHQFLKAGENTLNLKLCALAWSLCQEGYSRDEYMKRYIAYMQNPDSHRDTYIEECHRGFFTNLARGKKPDKCAVVEKHIGGLAHLFPVYLATGDRDTALHHMAVTHAGSQMQETGKQVLDVLQACLKGEGVEETARVLLGKRLTSWLPLPDEEVIGPRLSTACYVEDSWPAVLYLLMKYLEDPRKALEVNTNLGGDNCYRGAVLGALLGAYHGEEAWPAEWVEELLEPPGTPPVQEKI